MKKLIALLLCFVMILSVMTACGSSGGGSNSGIVGTWKANVKLSDYEDMDMAGMEEFIDVDKMVIGLTLKFDKNGEYTLSVDSKSIDKLVDVMCDGMEDYMKDAAKQIGMSYKEMLSLMGVSSIRELLEAEGMMEEFEALKEMRESGEYTWEDGVLTIDGDEVDYELKGNTLTLDVYDMEVKFTRK